MSSEKVVTPALVGAGDNDHGPPGDIGTRPTVAAVMREFGSGAGMTDSTVLRLAHSWQESRKKTKLAVGALIMTCFLLFVQCAVMAGITWHMIDTAKEFRIVGETAMRNGAPIQVANSDFVLAADGVLHPRSGPSQSKAVAVTSFRVDTALSSTLPDSAFQTMDSIFHQGQRLKVMGFTRIQTRSSKCGSVVLITTSEGVLEVDDTDVSMQTQPLEGRRLRAADVWQAELSSESSGLANCSSMTLPDPEIWQQGTFGFHHTAWYDGKHEYVDGGVKTWSDVQFIKGERRVMISTYPLHPDWKELTITTGNLTIRANINGTTLTWCEVQPTPDAKPLELLSMRRAQDGMTTLRRYSFGDATRGPIVIYDDVDIDPTGKLRGGAPVSITTHLPGTKSSVRSVITRLGDVPEIKVVNRVVCDGEYISNQLIINDTFPDAAVGNHRGDRRDPWTRSPAGQHELGVDANGDNISALTLPDPTLHYPMPVDYPELVNGSRRLAGCGQSATASSEKAMGHHRRRRGQLKSKNSRRMLTLELSVTPCELTFGFEVAVASRSAAFSMGIGFGQMGQVTSLHALASGSVVLAGTGRLGVTLTLSGQAAIEAGSPMVSLRRRVPSHGCWVYYRHACTPAGNWYGNELHRDTYGEKYFGTEFSRGACMDRKNAYAAWCGQHPDSIEMMFEDYIPWNAWNQNRPLFRGGGCWFWQQNGFPAEWVYQKDLALAYHRELTLEECYHYAAARGQHHEWTWQKRVGQDYVATLTGEVDVCFTDKCAALGLELEVILTQGSQGLFIKGVKATVYTRLGVDIEIFSAEVLGSLALEAKPRTADYRSWHLSLVARVCASACVGWLCLPGFDESSLIWNDVITVR